MKILFQFKSIIYVDTDTLITTNDPFQSEFFKMIEFVLQQDQEKRQFELTSVYKALHDKTEALTRSEAIAISVVKWALCQVEPAGKGTNALALLPKKKWWRLFIDQQYQEGYEPGSANDIAWALRFDLDQSPGFFNALISLYEDVLAPVDPKLPIKELTPDMYKSYHRRVTNKCLAALSPQFYAQVESDWSGYGVSFGMANLVRKTPDQQALVELIQAQELGLSWQN